MSDERKYRCTKCGCLWRLNPPSAVQPEGSWSLFDAQQKSCAICDNSPEFLNAIERVYTSADEAEDARMKQSVDGFLEQYCDYYSDKPASPQGAQEGETELAIKPTEEAADAFWSYWRANGETHKHGYYESTWGAINNALRVAGVVMHNYQGSTPTHPASHASAPNGRKCADCTMDNDPCPTCYSAWWKKKYPNTVHRNR